MDNLGIKAEIDRIEQERANKAEKTREEKRNIAFNHYEESKKMFDREPKQFWARQIEFWWNEYCKLDGDYIIRQDINQKSEVEVKQQQQEIIREEVNRALVHSN